MTWLLTAKVETMITLRRVQSTGCDYDGEMGTYDFVSALISESILNRTITSRSSGRAAGGIASFGRSRFFAMEQRLRGAPLNSGVMCSLELVPGTEGE